MRILIADDEVFIRYMIRNLIDWNAEGFDSVADVDNGLGALEYINTYKPEIALLDIQMPGMTGMQVAKKASESAVNTQIVIISGYAEFSYAQEALRNDLVVDYLLKPLDAAMMHKAVSQCKKRMEQHKSTFEEDSDAIKMKIADKIASDDWVSRAIEEVRNNITKNTDLTELAQKYNVSVGHLSKLIQQKLGVNYSEYIMTQRMDLAKHLLQTTSLSVSQIAYDIGYKDPLYFSKLFKRYCQVSPNEYRRH